MKRQDLFHYLKTLSLVIICLVFLTGTAAATKPPVITSIIPEKAAAGTNITLTLHGSGFEKGAGIVLTPVKMNPVLISSIPGGFADNFLIQPMAVVVSGNYAYVAGLQLDIINITDPANPARVSSTKTLTNGVDLFVAGRYAYVTGGNGLDIIDISDPAKPVHAGYISSDNSDSILQEAFGVAVSRNHAYVVSVLTDTLEVFDVTNREKPVFRSRITNRDFGAKLNNINNIYISGNYAYVTSAASNAFEIIDITNPVMPDHKGCIWNGAGGALLTIPSGVHARGNYAYVTSYGDNALEIIDITNPEKPVHMGSLRDGETGAWLKGPYNVIVSANYAFVGTDRTMEIIDITDPAHPYHTFSTNDKKTETQGPRRAFDVSGRYAYVTRLNCLSNYNSTKMDMKSWLDIFDLGFIPAANITVQTPDSASCSVDLDGEPAGLYNIVITNPDGQIGVLPRGFEIPAEKTPEQSPRITEPSGTTPSTDIFPFLALIGTLMLVFFFRRDT